MRFSILHISDLHRDLGDEVDNASLLESLERDFREQAVQELAIAHPSICIVSGDLVFGVSRYALNPRVELSRQYDQAHEFLVGLADRFFGGDRNRVVMLPGNHDVSYSAVMACVARVTIPADTSDRASLAEELFAPNSRLRWSWSELCFYRIVDERGYLERLQHFAELYRKFYNGHREFSLEPECQYAIFDFPSLTFCVLALNSCYSNDPFRRAGAFHPAALTSACRALGAVDRSGWLMAAAWHHSFHGGPFRDDYLDAAFLQLLIQAGASLGFHGHQHSMDCVDERYRFGASSRKMTIISAGTLCAGPKNLTPGVPRSYNLVEVDTDQWTGRVHQRQMVNQLFSMPVWGPGHVVETNRSFVDFKIGKPLTVRPRRLDSQLAMERAEKLIGERRWEEAADALAPLSAEPMARVLLVRALGELANNIRTMKTLWPPTTVQEAVVVGWAVLESGDKAMAEDLLALPLLSSSVDASVREIVRRVHERWAL